MAIRGPIMSFSLGFDSDVFTFVFPRVTKVLPECAHRLVDEGGKWRSVVALEARMMQVVVLVALEVIFVPTVTSGGAER